MEKNLPKQNNNHHSGDRIRLIIKSVIPIVFLFGGLWLLTLKLAGWSIIFGIPMIVMGIVFLIYAYDDAVSGKIKTSIDTDDKKNID